MCQKPDDPSYPLPQYCFLEPAFRGSAEDDQHPLADVMNGELLIAKVYNSVGSSDIWNKCLLIVTYDELGDFTITLSHLQPFPGRPDAGVRF